MKRFRDTEYFVSKEGVVYRNGKKLSKTLRKDGYEIVSLWKNNKGKTYLFHRVLAELFIPNPNNLEQVNHINGIKNDNRIENLEWVSPLENTRHAIRNGLMNNNGENNGNSVLSNIQAEEIKNQFIPYSRTNGLRALSRKYRVHRLTIKNIITNKHYNNFN